MNKRILQISLAVLGIVLLSGCTLAGDTSSLTQDLPGFVMGLWHGIVAPYTLIVRFFIDIKMYINPIGGFGYDLGFLIGLLASIPVGWLATIISIAVYLLL